MEGLSTRTTAFPTWKGDMGCHFRHGTLHVDSGKGPGITLWYPGVPMPCPAALNIRVTSLDHVFVEVTVFDLTGWTCGRTWAAFSVEG